MRFVLCGINAKYIHSNLAVFSLKAYTERKKIAGAEIVLREYTINHYVEDILQDLYESRPDVLIFSCYIWNISYVRELAAELKKIRPDLRIWVGGPEVSYHAAEFLKENPAVDLVMQGEGEEVFSELVRNALKREAEAALTLQGEASQTDAAPELQRETGRTDAAPALPEKPEEAGEAAPAKELKRMPGIAFWCGGEVIDNGFAPLMDMDALPFVYEDFHLFEHKILYYETSRGCPFRCSYCLSSVDKTVRFRSLAKVKDELARFLMAKVPQVKFVDRTFNCNRGRALAIWRYLVEHDNGVTNFHFEISSDLLGEEEIALFSKMRPGLIQLEIGVQSTNAATVDAIHRHMDLAKLFFYVDRVHMLGNIHQHLDLIAGLPFEDYARFGKSFDDLYAHAPDQLQLGFLKVLKGTVMEEDVKRYGIVYRSLPPYEVLQTEWLSYEEVILLKGVEELVELYYNSGQYTYTLRYIVPRFESPFRFFEKFSAYYRGKGFHKVSHNRLEKYNILRDFLREEVPEEKREFLDEIMLFDMYLRENVKGRPSWAPDLSPFKKKWKEMYRTEGERLFAWQFSGSGAGENAACEAYDSKRAANQSHIEPFPFDVEKMEKTGRIEKKDVCCLFDYGKRNPLNRAARIVVWENTQESEWIKHAGN